MKTIEQRRLEFLQDTVNYYSEDTSRRAVDAIGSCEYCTYDGRRCAIGRVIDVDHNTSKLLAGLSVSNKKVFELVPNEIKELGEEFLNEIQYLHDNYYFWSDTGLTIIGQKEVDKLIQEYCS